MTGQGFLQMLAQIFLRTDSMGYYLITSVLLLAGMWGIFVKCGLKGWHALIPCVSEVNLGLASGREKEGRVAAAARAVIIVMIVIDFILNAGANSNPEALDRYFNLESVIRLLAEMVLLIYTIRMYIGLTEVFGQKRRWLLLWIPFDFIPACMWGWMKKYQPQWTVEELKTEAANYFSGARAEVLDQGLTVNLEERTATEFFKKKYLLRDIHMYIQPGHMVLLLGGSGAGKTTYLNAVNGYEKAKAEVVLNGKNMYKNYKEMQYDIGFVPQLDLMRGSDSVYRTLMDAASLRLPSDFTKAQREARVEEVMEIFGLTPVKDNLVVKLSGGQRKRLSIAMEFIPNPSLFILDEPDSGLDGVMARELFQQLRMIADQGKIIIVITRTPDRVIDLFDDVIVLAKDANRTGRLAYFGPIEEARTFFGRDKMEEIVKSINRKEEGGDGLADEFILKYAEVQHG